MYTARQMRNVIVAFRNFLGSRLRRIGLAVVCACEMEAVCADCTIQCLSICLKLSVLYSHPYCEGYSFNKTDSVRLT